MDGCPDFSWCIKIDPKDAVENAIGDLVQPAKNNLCYPPGKEPAGTKLDEYNTCTGFCQKKL